MQAESLLSEPLGKPTVEQESGNQIALDLKPMSFPFSKATFSKTRAVISQGFLELHVKTKVLFQSSLSDIEPWPGYDLLKWENRFFWPQIFSHLFRVIIYLSFIQQTLYMYYIHIEYWAKQCFNIEHV